VEALAVLGRPAAMCPALARKPRTCSPRTRGVPVFNGALRQPELPIGPFTADKLPVIDTPWCDLMLMSDAECGSVLSSDV
jgi:hypothetical protein